MGGDVVDAADFFGNYQQGADSPYPRGTKTERFVERVAAEYGGLANINLADTSQIAKYMCEDLDWGEARKQLSAAVREAGGRRSTKKDVFLSRVVSIHGSLADIDPAMTARIAKELCENYAEPQARKVLKEAVLRARGESKPKFHPVARDKAVSHPRKVSVGISADNHARVMCLAQYLRSNVEDLINRALYEWCTPKLNTERERSRVVDERADVLLASDFPYQGAHE